MQKNNEENCELKTGRDYNDGKTSRTGTDVVQSNDIKEFIETNRSEITVKKKNKWDIVRNSVVTNSKSAVLPDEKPKTSLEFTQPKVTKITTTTKYSIAIYETEDQRINPNEVFYVKNPTPRRSSKKLNTTNRGQNTRNSCDLEDKITAEIIKDQDFDQFHKKFSKIISGK
jgi:hypothetical protein